MAQTSGSSRLPDQAAAKQIVVTVFAGNYNKYHYRSGQKVFARVMGAVMRDD
ncbi:MAG: hypothetical protein VCD33_09380 [Alphaproteobacteria bacterium]|jgi:hypothetical protein